MSDTDLHARIDFSSAANPERGVVRWTAQKSLWWTGMLVGWIAGGTIWFSWSAVFVFVALCAVTLCLGHSLGMHRKLIHEAYDAPIWVERVFVYLGTLVGLGGPFGMMVMHDMRDWAQRQAACHPFLSHQSNLARDFWWQIHCKLHLKFRLNIAFLSGLRRIGFISSWSADGWCNSCRWQLYCLR